MVIIGSPWRRLLGQHEVAAVVFEGNSGEAFAEAVRCNVTHGLPLTLDERRTAALRLLRDLPDWSTVVSRSFAVSLPERLVEFGTSPIVPDSTWIGVLESMVVPA